MNILEDQTKRSRQATKTAARQSAHKALTVWFTSSMEILTSVTSQVRSHTGNYLIL
jgi:hypothetical protein